MFSRPDPGHALLRDGAGGVLPRLIRRGSVTIEFVEDADHTFSRSAWRRDLVRVVAARLEARS